MQGKNKGFTLIELLVVIAIIGILASVVLASLNTARDKGADAAIKSNLNNARAQAELYYDDNSQSYEDVCDANSAADPAGISDFVANAGSAGSAATDCDDGAAQWAAEAQMKSDTSQYYCVDWSGKATTTGASKGGTATACP